MSGLLEAVLKKAPAFAGAFFAFVIFATNVRADSCWLNKQAGPVEKVQLDYVVDGDTLWLKDGRKVRLISINAPETEREERPAEPYGKEAKQGLERLLVKQKDLLLQTQGKDHYGRVLGHLLTADGQLVSAALLGQGLGFQTFMEAPHLYSDCLKAQEAKARKEKLGVWHKNPVIDLTGPSPESGFHLVYAELDKVSRPGKGDALWLEMKNNLVVKISKQVASQAWLNSLQGHKLEIRGWLIDRKEGRKLLKKGFKRWLIPLYQTDSIRVINDGKD